VNLNILIEKIYISPVAATGGMQPLIEFLKLEHHLDAEIIISGVNDIWI
jgi:hypothetical protein